MNPLWCNGQWLEARDFPVSPADRGWLLGLGLFETLLALEGEPVFVELHLARLRAGCERLGWRLEPVDYRALMRELLNHNGLANRRARIRLAISGGSGSLRGLELGVDHLVWMTAVPAVEMPVELSVNIAPWVRNERSPLAGLKCASYAENIVALDHAARLGFEETLFFNTTGHLCEAATANLFLVKNGGLFTPPLDAGCLPGITRGVVIELAAAIGLPCESRPLLAADLDAADEVFLTSATRGVIAVTRLEDRPLVPGPVTRAVQDAWHAAVRQKI